MPKEFKKAVIAGAGPMGLFAAAMLAKKGMEVTIVDLRAGTYGRPGLLDKNSFEALSHFLGTTLDHSPAYHIKDMERALYRIAYNTSKIKILKKSFNRFVNKKKIELIDANKKTSKLECDLLLECTGAKRALVNAVNEQTDPPYFTEVSIAKNPVKNHFLAYVEMTPEHVALLKTPLPKSKDPLEHTLALEELRKFGWTKFAEPYFHFIYADKNKNKVCLYFETPKNLPLEQQEAWLKALLRLKTGEKDIDFKQLTSKKPYPKPRFTAFTMDPKQITPIYYPGDDHTPTVVVAGDALVDPDYRLGIGTRNGANRIMALIDSATFNLKKKMMTIDFEQYKTKIQPYLDEYFHKMTNLYSKRKAEITAAPRNEVNNYLQALKKLKKNTPEYRTIKQALSDKKMLPWVEIEKKSTAKKSRHK